MSMWEIEALMENTVILIDNSAFTLSEKRNFIWNTYNLQKQFDCSFTHFRLMAVLIKNEYVQQYEIEEFPMKKDYPVFFSELSVNKFEWIRKNPNEKWSEENPEIAYWDQRSNKIYADYGSKYYTKFPNESVKKVAPLDFGLKIIEMSHTQNNKSNVYNWTAFMIIYLLEWFPSEKTSEELKEKYFKKIKTMFQKFDFSDYEVLHRGLDLNNNEDIDYLSETQQELIKYISK